MAVSRQMLFQLKRSHNNNTQMAKSERVGGIKGGGGLTTRVQNFYSD